MLFQTIHNELALKDQSTFEPTFYSKVEKIVHVGATTFCFGSKFQFFIPDEIFAIQNCMKNLNLSAYWSEGIGAVWIPDSNLFIETIDQIQ